MNYPRCERRGLLIDTEAGPRVAMGPLYSSFDVDDRLAWERYAGRPWSDGSGILPEGIERFLETISPDRQLTFEET